MAALEYTIAMEVAAAEAAEVTAAIVLATGAGTKRDGSIVGTLRNAGQGTLKNDPTRNGKGTAEGNLDSTENECRTEEMNN